MLLQRAGWEVQLAPTLDGSYEGAPPGLIELATRDRRWAQGNLQHMAILARPGVTRMGRIHLAMGVGAYLVSAVWAISLIVGLVLALQGQQIVPSYFEDSKTLVPIWPVIDPGAALRLFIATMAVVLLPKALGLVIAIDRAYAADDVVGIARVTGGMVLETAISMLLAPIMMVMQTVAVIQIVAGIDAGWKAQRRDGDGIRLSEALKFHAWHMAARGGGDGALLRRRLQPDRLDGADPARPDVRRVRDLPHRPPCRPDHELAAVDRGGPPAAADPATGRSADRRMGATARQRGDGGINASPPEFPARSTSAGGETSRRRNRARAPVSPR